MKNLKANNKLNNQNRLSNNLSSESNEGRNNDKKERSHTGRTSIENT